MAFDYPRYVWDMRVLLDQRRVKSVLKAAEEVARQCGLPPSRVQSLRKRYSVLERAGRLPEQPPVPHELSEELERRYATIHANQAEARADVERLRNEATAAGLELPDDGALMELQTKLDSRLQEIAEYVASFPPKRAASRLMDLRLPSPRAAEEKYVELKTEHTRLQQQVKLVRDLRHAVEWLRSASFTDVGTEPEGSG